MGSPQMDNRSDHDGKNSHSKIYMYIVIIGGKADKTKLYAGCQAIDQFLKFGCFQSMYAKLNLETLQPTYMIFCYLNTAGPRPSSTVVTKCLV